MDGCTSHDNFVMMTYLQLICKHSAVEECKTVEEKTVAFTSQKKCAAITKRATTIHNCHNLDILAVRVTKISQVLGSPTRASSKK